MFHVLVGVCNRVVFVCFIVYGLFVECILLLLSRFFCERVDYMCGVL